MLATIPYECKCKACGHVYTSFHCSGGGFVCRIPDPNLKPVQVKCPKCGSTKSEVAGLWDQIKAVIRYTR